MHQELQVKFYEEVFEKLTIASRRLEDKNPPEYRALMTNLQEVLTLISDEKSDMIMQMGLELGFRTDWVQKKKVEKNKKKTADRMAELET